MSNVDISINNLGLEESLNEIESIMKEINEDFTNMDEAYKSLNSDYWVGPEKNQLDEKYGTLLEDRKNNTYSELNKHLTLLRTASKLYQDTNADIERQTQDLEDYNG